MINYPRQQALKKLDTEWKTAYQLRIPLSVLHDLVKQGYAERKYKIEAVFAPQHNILFKKK